VKRPSLPPTTAARWLGTAFLLGAAAGQGFAAGTLSGKLTAPATRSVSGAQVTATDAKFHAFRATVNDDGTYSLGDLDPGTYTVVVTGKGTEPVVTKDVAIADGQEVKKDFTLEEVKVFRIIKAPKPIPLDDDYNSASFADAPEIHVDEPWQLVLGIGTGDLTTWDPTQVSGKFRFKYSDQALHLAADLNLKSIGVNNWPDMGGQEAWDGNHIDLDFQNDPYDPKRDAYNKDHDWQIVVTLNDNPAWKIFQTGLPPDDQNPPQEKTKDFVRFKPKADGSGQLVRIDFPWTLFHANESKKGPIPVPADNSLGALDISVGAVDPDQSREDARLKNRLSWTGFFPNWQDPRILKPVTFTPQP
jgi:hypothetical protein